MVRRVRVGLERALAERRDAIAGKRLGLLCNPTSVDAELRHAIDLLRSGGEHQLCALYGPEHGVRGDAQDMVAVGAAVDPGTGLPVYSLYGQDEASLRVPVESLRDLDALLFDIQDVGARYYTYLWTMVLAMESCAAAGVELIVLDRPNPLGGVSVEGGLVESGYRSFVGLYSVANRHGLTAGELAGYINRTHDLGCRLTVVTLEGWQRHQHYDETGLPWVMPSPNMPTLDTAFVYPGLCLIEGTELSEGRGTTRPFEIIGAPFVDGEALLQELDPDDLPGLRLRPLAFRPTFHKFAGAVCGGVQLHVTDRRSFRPYRTGIALIRAVRARWPDDFRWRTRPYEFVSDQLAIDLLCGGPMVREMIDAGESTSSIMAALAPEESQFRQEREPHLLY